MPLDAYVVSPADPKGHRRILVQFQDDGYFWFLYDAFKDVAERTGEQVDLYGDAAFQGEHLLEFQTVIRDWRGRIESSPDRWSVTTGHVLDARGQETGEILTTEVDKGKLLRLVDDLLSAANTAYRTRGRLAFVGD
jgi:hypothetical protein